MIARLFLQAFRQWIDGCERVLLIKSSVTDYDYGARPTNVIFLLGTMLLQCTQFRQVKQAIWAGNQNVTPSLQFTFPPWPLTKRIIGQECLVLRLLNFLRRFVGSRSYKRTHIHANSIGRALLGDAIIRCGGLSNEIGAAAIVLDVLADANHARRKAFYLNLGFAEINPENSSRLFLSIRDAKATIVA